VIVIFDFVNFFPAMSNNNIDPVVIWWWLRQCKKRGNGKRKHWVHPFFHDNLNSGAYIVSKELSQNCLNHFIK
jgi:hypothetical protein